MATLMLMNHMRQYPLRALLFVDVLLLLVHCCSAWREWTWTNSTGPGARSGHSLVFYKSQLIVFGGRTSDTSKTHIPKTYEIYRVNGSLEFLSYEDKIARPSDSTEVRVGVFLNDVWSYDINCTRYADDSCRDKTWVVLNAGAAWGGCKNVFGAHVCSHPSERWFHRAEVFKDDTMLIYGGFSAMCEDYCDDMWLFDFTDNSWTEMMEIGNSVAGPGKRFKFSSVVIDYKIYLFGGFRLWQGFAHENSLENDWSDISQYPKGGYLNDLWVYDKQTNKWSNLTETVVCPELTVVQVLENIEVECTLAWPPSRAGHSSDVYKDAIYIHGGYRTFFPYPSTTGAGAGRGTLTMRGTAFTPYPTHPYYLSDLWKFNLTTGVWQHLTVNEDDEADQRSYQEKFPPPRLDHTIVVADDVFLLFGGYITNFYFDDTWQYNITFNRWRKLSTFVYAKYPASCTDDLALRKLEHSGNYAAFRPPADLGDDLNGYYFIKERHYGTLTFSVLAEPTRDSSNEVVVFVQQARRQAPGWDGCRDRSDGRSDLPQQLQWQHPSQRSAHMSAYNSDFKKLFVYGGRGFAEESLYQVAKTLESTPLGDLWQYDMANCPKNCSLHGNCHYGSCRCHDGYYGEDCSNSTCPGSFCYYDDIDHHQICEHCCFSGFEHTDNDTYVENIQKYPCTHDNPHYSNGICDGFGKCICRPPFIGDDCSIRDCGKNCSGHGYCSAEFPNSRCLCDDGWFGKYCDERLCLNNCSYPNGVCMNGSCFCSMVYEPYNNSLEYFPLMGEDCSFLLPFARAVVRSSAALSVVLISTLARRRFALKRHQPATTLSVAAPPLGLPKALASAAALTEAHAPEGAVYRSPSIRADLSVGLDWKMPSYGGGSGGYGQQNKHALLVEYDEEDDLYEGFNYSIDLAPPQTASTNAYQPSSYGGGGGVPASRGGFNPPGTAFRAPPSQMGRQAPASRMGTASQQGGAGEARPMTSVSGAGFSSNPRTAAGQRMFDPLGEARKAGAAPPLIEKAENSPKEVARDLERAVNSLIEQSADAILKHNYEEALHSAKDAGRKERAFTKHCETNALTDLLNVDLTYAVFFNLANAYHLNGLWKEAIQAYTPIVKNKQYAHGGRLRVNMGNIYYEQQQYPTAIRMYRMALDQIPNTSKEIRYKIKRNIGAAQIRLGHYQDAAATFEDVMEGNADFQSGFNLIICYYAIGENERMRRGFTNLIAIPMDGLSEEEEEEELAKNDPSRDDMSERGDHSSSRDHLDSLKADGLKAEIRARRKKAMEYILIAAKLCAPALDKKDWLAGYNWVIDALKQETHEALASEMEICKAHCFLRQKEFDKAIEVLKAFEKKDHVHKAMAATNLSFLYFIEGDIAQADKYASMAVRHQRYNAKALVNKGNCLYVKNECERAKELFLEAIGVEADCIEAIYNLGLVNIKMGVLNEALQAFEKLHSIVPSNIEVLYQIANLHDLMGNYRHAAKWFNILISCFGNGDKPEKHNSKSQAVSSIGSGKNVADPGVFARLGQIFNKDDDETQAFHYHLESYRYFPINLDVISWLGVWYVKSELYEKAIQFFERASQIQPTEVKWRLMVTSCYRRMGSYQKAMVLYEQIHQDYPENLECLRYLVAICKDLGQRCDQYQNKLAKLERDHASNSKMQTQLQQQQQQQQQQSQSSRNGGSSARSEDNDDRHASHQQQQQYYTQQQQQQYARENGARYSGGSNSGQEASPPRGTSASSRRDEEESEYAAPRPLVGNERPQTAAQRPAAQAIRSAKNDDDDWGDADVGNLLGD